MLRATYNVSVKGWAIVMFVVCIVGAVAGGITWSDHLNHRYSSKLHTETLNREHDSTVRQLETDYSVCTKIDGVLDAMRSVVETAYKGTVTVTPAQVAKLPKVTRDLLVDLEPLLSTSSRSSGVTKAAVLAKVPASPKCHDPSP